MTLPYDLHVHFEKLSADGDLAGAVTVTVRQGCTCRKLLVRPGAQSAPNEDFQPDGKVQTLGDWEEWRAGETYTYPFSFNLDGAPTLQRGVETEVHRIGEWDADPAQVWPVESTSELAEVQSHPDAPSTRPDHDSPSGLYRESSSAGRDTDLESLWSTIADGPAPEKSATVKSTRPKPSSKRCPDCGLISHRSALWCDCGYDFQWGELRTSTAVADSVEAGPHNRQPNLSRSKDEETHTGVWMGLLIAFLLTVTTPVIAPRHVLRRANLQRVQRSPEGRVLLEGIPVEAGERYTLYLEYLPGFSFPPSFYVSSDSDFRPPAALFDSEGNTVPNLMRWHASYGTLSSTAEKIGEFRAMETGRHSLTVRFGEPTRSTWNDYEIVVRRARHSNVLLLVLADWTNLFVVVGAAIWLWWKEAI